MTKRILEPAAMIHPLPVVLLSSRHPDGGNNIITLAWAGIVCSRPPMVNVGIRPATHSHGIVCSTREFVINLPDEEHLEAVQLCGMRSGRDLDKFAACGFTATRGQKVEAPLIEQCPVNLECVVRHIVGAGSHDVFMGEIVAVHVEDSIADERGLPRPELRHPIMLNLGGYYGLGQKLGKR